MTSCNHTRLLLLPDETKDKLRCRHCHLVINAKDLADGYCPECFETRGKRHFDFDHIEDTARTGITRYRCEECGMIIECS